MYLAIGKLLLYQHKANRKCIILLGGPAVDRNKALTFNLLSTRDANPPVFTLYFEVTNTPPTTVTCSVNGNTFNITEEDLYRVPDISTDPIRVAVIATIRKREAGKYICTVITDISVSPAPFQTTATTPGINISGKLQL